MNTATQIADNKAMSFKSLVASYAFKCVAFENKVATKQFSFADGSHIIFNLTSKSIVVKDLAPKLSTSYLVN